MNSRLFKVGTVAILLVLLGLANSGLMVQASPLLQDKPPFCPPYISIFNMTNILSDLEPTGEANAAATAEAGQLPPFCHIMAVLSGTLEVPKAGDSDGAGMFLGYYDTKTGKFCYEIDVTNIAAATAAHIHMAEFGQAGDVYVPLTQPNANGTVAACLPVNAENNDLIVNVFANPLGFYVNVHNEEFPGGAVRGQLIGAAKLDGAKEVPGPGDTRGYGVGAVVIETATADTPTRLCTALFVRGIALPASAAHIHQGAADEAGDVFIPIAAPNEMGHAMDCLTGESDEDKSKIKTLLENPGNFYFNVHTEKFPKGAIRSEQLTASPNVLSLAEME